MSQIALILHLRRAHLALHDAREALAAHAGGLDQLGLDLAGLVNGAQQLVDDAGCRLREFQRQQLRQTVEEIAARRPARL